MRWSTWLATLCGVWTCLLGCGAEPAVQSNPDVTGTADVGPDSDAGVSGTTDVVGADTLADPCGAPCAPPAQACRVAACQPGVGCVTLLALDGVLCDDDDACSEASACKGGSCVAVSAKPCDDANPCTSDSCSAGQCQHSNLSGPSCDDGADCTVETTCLAGSCQGGVTVCQCTSTADCAKLNDANLCNGNWFCNPTSHTCQINPASVVACKDDGLPCTEEVCQPASGTCAVQPVENGTPCTDGSSCTQGDGCQDGVCVPGLASCCANDADCAAIDDGNLCNGKLFCNKGTGKCQLNPVTVVICPSVLNNECGQNLCDPLSGDCKAVLTANGTVCDDDNPCTESACQWGTCAVTTSICACQNDSDCADQEDGNQCNGTLYCELASKTCKVNPASLVVCPSANDTACASNLCQPASGLCAFVAKPDGVTCDADGNACTNADQCSSGVCKPGPSTCGCQTQADCLTQEDGNPCNGTLYCDQLANTCKVNPATVVVCSSFGNTPCAANTCLPQTGQCSMQPRNEGTLCEADGNPCTPNDLCAGGVCKASSNTCLCQSDADCSNKEDGNLCNGLLYCDVVSGQCKVNPASVVVCPSVDDSACQHNLCQPTTGLCAMVARDDLTSCDADGNPCTWNDRCQAGTCMAGSNVCQCGLDQDCGLFDDANVCNGKLTCTALTGVGTCTVAAGTQITCTAPADPQCAVSVCQPATGICSAIAFADGLACGDGLGCTGGDQCIGGVCLGTVPGCDDGEPCTIDTCNSATKNCTYSVLACNDGNPCTTDSCNSGLGCSFVANSAPCSDGDACATGDTCADKVCQAGSVVVDCDDNDPCTADLCTAVAGCVHGPSAGPCSDGDACTENDTCVASSCQGTAVVCADDNPCAVASCEPLAGCVSAPTNAPCSDGNACTTGDFCLAGSCTGGYGCVGGTVCDPQSGCNCPSDKVFVGETCVPVLGGLALSTGTLSPAFSPSITSYTVNNIGFAANTVRLQILASAPSIRWRVQGNLLPEGVYDVEVVVPTVAVTVAVLAEEASQTVAAYAISIQRKSELAYQGSKTDGVFYTNSFLGQSVHLTAVSALAGAPGRNSNIGAVHIWPRAGTTLGTITTLLSPAGNQAGGLFGGQLAVDGQRMVVGEAGRDTGMGAVHFYTVNKDDWTAETTIKPSTIHCALACKFGAALALNNTTAAIGAPGEDSATEFAPGVYLGSTGATDSGAVFLYGVDSGTWQPKQVLKHPGLKAGELFGSVLAMSESTLVIGVPGEDSGTAGDPTSSTLGNSGAVHVYEYKAGSWQPVQHLKAPNAGVDDAFGRSVSLSGDVLAIGATGEASGKGGALPDQADNTASGAGAVYVYVRTNGVWTFQQYLKAAVPDGSDNFGYSVALDGSRLVVGAYQEDGADAGVGGDQTSNATFRAGAAYLFQKTGGVWQQFGYLKDSHPSVDDLFGSAVAILGDVIAIGVPYGDTSPTGNGNYGWLQLFQ